MALYIPHSIFHLARLLYVRPETFGPYYVHGTKTKAYYINFCGRSDVNTAWNSKILVVWDVRLSIQ